MSNKRSREGTMLRGSDVDSPSDRENTDIGAEDFKSPGNTTSGSGSEQHSSRLEIRSLVGMQDLATAQDTSTSQSNLMEQYLQQLQLRQLLSTLNPQENSLNQTGTNPMTGISQSLSESMAFDHRSTARTIEQRSTDTSDAQLNAVQDTAQLLLAYIRQGQNQEEQRLQQTIYAPPTNETAQRLLQQLPSSFEASSAQTRSINPRIDSASQFQQSQQEVLNSQLQALVDQQRFNPMLRSNQALPSHHPLNDQFSGNPLIQSASNLSSQHDSGTSGAETVEINRTLLLRLLQQVLSSENPASHLAASTNLNASDSEVLRTLQALTSRAMTSHLNPMPSSDDPPPNIPFQLLQQHLGQSQGRHSFVDQQQSPTINQTIPFLLSQIANEQSRLLPNVDLTRMLSATTPGVPLGLPFATGNESVSLALPSDHNQLSEYQITVRQQLEFFVAKQEDVESNIQGRKKQVRLGQVGIRCRHCSKLPLRQRARGAIYYPTKLSGVYQAAQNMATTHLNQSCSSMPAEIRARLHELHNRRDTASGGKQYWAETCQVLGLYEHEDGIRFRDTGSNQG